MVAALQLQHLLSRHFSILYQAQQRMLAGQTLPSVQVAGPAAGLDKGPHTDLKAGAFLHRLKSAQDVRLSLLSLLRFKTGYSGLCSLPRSQRFCDQPQSLVQGVW